MANYSSAATVAARRKQDTLQQNWWAGMPSRERAYPQYLFRLIVHSSPVLRMTSDLSRSFSCQISGLGAKPGDLVVVITSSGNSSNILAALAEAKRLGLTSLAFLGRGGGKAKGLATCELIVPGDSGAAAQEAHLSFYSSFLRIGRSRVPGLNRRWPVTKKPILGLRQRVPGECSPPHEFELRSR